MVNIERKTDRIPVDIEILSCAEHDNITLYGLDDKDGYQLDVCRHTVFKTADAIEMKNLMVKLENELREIVDEIKFGDIV